MQGAAGILVTLIGIAIIATTFFDVFMTVLHPQAESPLSSRLQTFVWKVMRILSRGLRGRTRHRFLGLAVPLMIILLIGTWVLMLMIAFGLIYSSWLGAPGAFNEPANVVQHDWLTAMYFSGVTLATVGYGDIQPLHPLIRLTAVIEGFSGVLVLSMSIAYVLEIYPVLQRKSVLAVLLNEETAGHVSGLPMLTRYLRSQNFEALAELLRTINFEMLYLAEAHRRLPVLHYGHPVQVERSFLRVLLVVQNLVGTLRYGLAGGGEQKWSSDPRVHDLEDSLYYTLYTLGASMNLPLTVSLSEMRHKQDIELTYDELHTHLAKLRLPIPGEDAEIPESSPDLVRAREGFVEYHQSIDRALYSYLRNSGYTYNEATCTATRPKMLVKDLDKGEGLL